MDQKDFLKMMEWVLIEVMKVSTEDDFKKISEKAKTITKNYST
jgi:hypothetical protein